MGEARGVVSKDELKAYGGAEIMLLDGASDAIESSGEAAGSGNYGWAIRWDGTGFTGNGWNVPGWSDWEDKFAAEYQDGTLETYLENDVRLAVGIAGAMMDLGRYYYCVDLKS